MEFRDYYATLGLSKTATDKEIKQAYRRLARKLHPDVNPGDAKAEQRFKEINEAYEVLKNPETRKKYDELGANWRMYEQAGQGYGAPGRSGAWTVDFGAAGQPFTVEGFEEAFGSEDSPFSDFFRTFFGGGPAQARSARATPRRRPGSDLEQDITLTLEEAYQGVTKRLAIKSRGHARTVDVRIPAGVKDGARVRLAGEGEAGAGGGPSGDLFLRIHLRPHERFERRGHELHTRVQVPVLTAILGGEVEVPTLAGRTLRLKVPEATQNGQVFRLRGHGMPTAGRQGDVGDLYVAVEVVLPRHVLPEERQHYEALRRLAGGADGHGGSR